MSAPHSDPSANPAASPHDHASPFLSPNERVLPTLNRDGSRRWLTPRLSPGRYLRARRLLAWFLVVLFTAIPYLQLSGKPLVLLDIVHRRFTLFGTTFFATDTVLFMLLMLSLLLGIFLLTALLGRAWCGWACPQTVYMEFIFRPLERLIEGTPRSRGAPVPPTKARRALKLLLFTLLSMYLAHTFLAYFVGVEALRHWVTGSPSEHPAAFAMMAVTTGLMLFNFGYFREQTCMVACPYGRFQSVLLDRRSLIVGYDPGRGEPRGRAQKRESLPIVAADAASAEGPGASARSGDCIDCGLCVITCPTGIDIRDGLQMECLHCTQCIDACDAVMDKVGRPRGLVRYTSKDELDGKPRHLLRWRTVLYPTLMAVAIGTFATVLVVRKPAQVTVLRGIGTPYERVPSGEVQNQIRIKVANRSMAAAEFRIELLDAPGARLIAPQNPLPVGPQETKETSVFVLSPPELLSSGRLDVKFRVTSPGYETVENYRLLGPSGVELRK